MRRSHLLAVVALLFVAAAWAGCGNETPTPPAKAPATAPVAPKAPDLDKEAKAAVDRGLKFLMSKVQPDGSWEGGPGVTAIVTLAILMKVTAHLDWDEVFTRNRKTVTPPPPLPTPEPPAA